MSHIVRAVGGGDIRFLKVFNGQAGSGFLERGRKMAEIENHQGLVGTFECGDRGVMSGCKV